MKNCLIVFKVLIFNIIRLIVIYWQDCTHIPFDKRIKVRLVTFNCLDTFVMKSSISSLGIFKDGFNLSVVLKLTVKY